MVKFFIEFKTNENANDFLYNYSCTNDNDDDEPKEILFYEGKRLNVLSKETICLTERRCKI